MLRTSILAGGIGLSCFMLSCSSSSSGPAGDGQPGSLDGTWDITSEGTSGTAQMTVKGDSITGYITKPEEGQIVEGTDCRADKSRTEFAINANGNALTATRSEVRHGTGSTCSDYWRNGESHVLAFSGARTRGAAPTQTDLNGDWTVNGGGSSWTATVNGLTITAQGTIQDGNQSKQTTLTVSVANNVVTVASSDSELAFAAHKRP